MGVGVGAKVEHIEVMLLQQTAAVRPLIEPHSDGHGDTEHRQGAEHRLMLGRHVAAAQQMDADGQHRAVADHSLDVDTHRLDEHVAGINHHAQTCEHSKSGQIGAQAAVHPSAGKTRQQTHVHRRGAELEREGAPREAVGNALFVRKTEVDHLVHLQHHNGDGGDQHHTTDVALILFAVYAQQHAGGNG